MDHLNDVANSWEKLYTDGNFEEAKELLAASLRHLDEEDPNRVSIQNNIGLIHFSQKNYPMAKYYINLALQKMGQQGHPHTLICKLNLTWTYTMMDQKTKAESLVQELLASTRNPNSLDDPLVREISKVIGHLAKMRIRPSRSNPSEIDKICPNESVQFTLFHSLPAELRNLIWMFAGAEMVMRPKRVTIIMQDNKIKTAYTQTQNLPLVCSESYRSYFKQYFLHNRDSLIFGERGDRLAVNFADDIFHVTGGVDRLSPLLMTEILSFRKIALDKPQNSIHEFLHALPKLQEFWLLFERQDELNLLSEEECQQVWSAHHCDEFPNEYTSLMSRFENISPCPVCDWAARFQHISEEDLAPRNHFVRAGPQSQVPRKNCFVLTYSSSIPVLPTPCEIRKSKKPMLRWVRRDISNLSDPSGEPLGCDRWSHFHTLAVQYFQKNIGTKYGVVRALMNRKGPKRIDKKWLTGV